MALSYFNVTLQHLPTGNEENLSGYLASGLTIKLGISKTRRSCKKHNLNEY
jgi:hypothetical protein